MILWFRRSTFLCVFGESIQEIQKSSQRNREPVLNINASELIPLTASKFPVVSANLTRHRIREVTRDRALGGGYRHQRAPHTHTPTDKADTTWTQFYACTRTQTNADRIDTTPTNTRVVFFIGGEVGTLIWNVAQTRHHHTLRTCPSRLAGLPIWFRSALVLARSPCFRYFRSVFFFGSWSSTATSLLSFQSGWNRLRCLRSRDFALLPNLQKMLQFHQVTLTTTTKQVCRVLVRSQLSFVDVCGVLCLWAAWRELARSQKPGLSNSKSCFARLRGFLLLDFLQGTVRVSGKDVENSLRLFKTFKTF